MYPQKKNSMYVIVLLQICKIAHILKEILLLKTILWKEITGIIKSVTIFNYNLKTLILLFTISFILRIMGKNL